MNEPAHAGCGRGAREPHAALPGDLARDAEALARAEGKTLSAVINNKNN